MKSKSGAHGRREQRSRRSIASSGQQSLRRHEASEDLLRVRVWDLSTRAMHWLIIGLFAVLCWTGLSRTQPELHLWSGYLLLVVVLTRLIWGVIGSDSARFVRFVRGPLAVARYIPLLLSYKPTRWPGHNPVGAMYVTVILALLLVSALTGLFYESWAEVRGPLAERVPRAWAIALSDWHGVLVWPMLALVAVHALATLGYWMFKRENRIRPMFGDGRVRLERDPGFRMASPHAVLVSWALSILAVLAVAVFGPVA